MLGHFEIKKEVVLGLLKRIKLDKSPGPDVIYPRLLREAREEIAGALTKIFISSLATGEVLEGWQVANIVPLFGKGNRDNPGNYRPTQHYEYGLLGSTEDLDLLASLLDENEEEEIMSTVECSQDEQSAEQRSLDNADEWDELFDGDDEDNGQAMEINALFGDVEDMMKEEEEESETNA
eukprot:g42476.t1